MHLETTSDPDVVRWVVRGDLVRGPAVIRSISEEGSLPAQWEDALAFGDLTEIVVADGELLVRVRDQSLWPTLAPRLQQSLAAFFSDGHDIHLHSGGRSDEELAEAVIELLAGPLATYVASHGGHIELASVNDAVVTVRLSGACQGCPAAAETLKEGIENQLRAQYPEIVSVRAVEGKSRAENGRRLLPFISSR